MEFITLKVVHVRQRLITESNALTRHVLQVLLQEPDKRRDTPLHAAACNGFTDCADVRSSTHVFLSSNYMACV